MKKIALLLALILLPLFALAEAAPTYEDAVALYNQGRYDEAYPIFEQLALEGNRYAMDAAGICCATGRVPGGEIDPPKALEWFTKAAEQGLPSATFNIGYYYKQGLFTGQPEYALALEWYLKAADLGHGEAAFAAGRMYFTGEATGSPDYPAALPLFVRGAELGNTKAAYYAGYMHYYSKYGTSDDAKAFHYFSQCLEGDADIASDAHYHLGIMYREGRHVAQDADQAFLHFLQAAQGGSHDAIEPLEELAGSGKVSLEPLTQAAEAGYKAAMFALGEGWCSGAFGGNINYNTALDWYYKADAAGHYTAGRRILNMYYRGVYLSDGTALFPSDHAKMLRFLEDKHAAHTRDPYLLSWLGWLLCGNSDQNVCEPDYPRAVDVFVEAAYMGDAFSMMRLAEIMLSGKLGEVNAAEAMDWYKMAYLAGDQTAFSKVIDMYRDGLTAADGTVLLAPDDAGLLDYLEYLYAQDDLNAYGMSWLGWLLCGNSEQNVCEPDYPRALEVYTKGADLGDGYCMWQIGHLYLNGCLGEADPVAAEAWFRKAVAAGYARAQESLDQLLAQQAE